MAGMPEGDTGGVADSKTHHVNTIVQASEFAARSPHPEPYPSSDIAANPPEPLMHKNRLQEYTQRACIALPIYNNINEGFPHCPKFRSTVVVDGKTYTSPNAFSHRKAAEQDASKYAMDCILNKIKEERCSLIYEDASFCKLILHEFSTKMGMDLPVYQTSHPNGMKIYYEASLTFNGVTYIGEISQNKRTAEQFAARAAINTLLGKLESGKPLYEIIKSKARQFPAIWRLHNTKVACETADVDISEPQQQQCEILIPEPQPTLALLEQGYGHDFKKPKLETAAAVSGEEMKRSLPITFVSEEEPKMPLPSPQPFMSNYKKRKNKKNKNKKGAVDKSGGDLAVGQLVS